MGRVTVLTYWALHLSHSVEVGIAVVTEKLCQILTVLAVNPFLQYSHG